MIVIRLLPLIISTLLFSAHILRFFGLSWALVVLLLLITLFFRHRWILRFWQILTGFFIVEWLRISVEFVQYRLAMKIPCVRLLIIMGSIVLFNLFIVFWLQNKVIKKYYYSS